MERPPFQLYKLWGYASLLHKALRQNIPIVPIQLVGKEETKKAQLIQEHSFSKLEEETIMND